MSKSSLSTQATIPCQKLPAPTSAGIKIKGDALSIRQDGLGADALAQPGQGPAQAGVEPVQGVVNLIAAVNTGDLDQTSARPSSFAHVTIKDLSTVSELWRQAVADERYLVVVQN